MHARQGCYWITVTYSKYEQVTASRMGLSRAERRTGPQSAQSGAASASLSHPLERVRDAVEAVLGARERHPDPDALAAVEYLRLAVAAALGAGAVVLVTRAVSDADLRQVTHGRKSFGPSIGNGRPGGCG